MTPEILRFIPGLLVYNNKYIEVADAHFDTAKRIVEVQICKKYDTVKLLIVTLYNILFAP